MSTSSPTEDAEVRKPTPATTPRVVSRDAWTTARKALLEQEKAFSAQRDALAAARRALPAVRVETVYVFDTPAGSRSLADLFAGKRQLIVYHFMLEPTWDEGCRSCSFVSDHLDGALPHLAARDTALVAVSRASLARIEAFKARMGWRFPWVSSAGTSFNYDFGVTSRPEDVAAGRAEYNYEPTTRGGDSPGLSTFLRDGDAVLHAYSTYSRGLDTIINAYNLLDLTPLGRQEAGLKPSMAWVRHHDRYEA